MPGLVVFILIFVLVGVGFLATNLLVGKLIRPNRPSAEKGSIYECGEPAIGSAWIQFDLRFYVVALLFVIFDVEMAFFFPWAVIFGQATRISHGDAMVIDPTTTISATPEAAQSVAWIAFVDLMIFFGVLMVGFAYLWRRGDLDWVHSLAAQRTPQSNSVESSISSPSETR